MITRLALPILLLAVHHLQAQYLQVVNGTIPPYDDPTELIRQHLTGAGVDILNVEFFGEPAAVGYFTDGNQAIGLQRGLIMTTGKVQSANGIVGADETGIDFASTGNQIYEPDSILGPLVDAPLRDLNRYRISFRPRSDSIRFRYVFASEEYPEFSCSPYNDVFGFFLNGPSPDGGAPYQDFNIALVPGTNLPVAINNLHPANAVYPNCPPYNVQYYNDNNQSNLQPTYDGLTHIFVAEARVIPCAVYHMTLAIADVFDALYDSAVFLEAYSFGGEPDIAASFGPGDNLIPENAQADTISLIFNNIPATLLPLTVAIGGTAQNGTDFQLTDSVAMIATSDTVLYFLFQPVVDSLNEGFETIALTVSADSTCFTRTFTLFIADPDSIFKPEAVVYLVGGSATLGVVPTSLSASSWTFSNETDMPIDPVSTFVQSEIGVDLPFSTLDDISLLESVCVNIAHAWLDDLDLYLVAPDNHFVELSTDNGGNGDNYTATCFTPSATVPVNFPGPFAPPSAAPFSGVFQPEGEWTDILSTPLNGAWKLGLMDDNSGFAGTLLDWSITFTGQNLGAFHYLWSTGDTTAELTVTQPGTYKVTVSNTVSSFEKTFIVLPECPVSTLNLVVCPGASVTFDSLVLNENNPSGQVTYDLPGDCDSTVSVHLAFFPPAYDSLEAVIQEGEMFQFGNQILTQAGDYNIVLTSVNGCDSTVYLHLDVLTGTSTPLDQSLRIQPNPVKGKVLVSWDKNLRVSRIRVFDAAGNRMIELQPAPNAAQTTLEMSAWPAGIYLLMLDAAAGAALRRLVKL